MIAQMFYKWIGNLFVLLLAKNDVKLPVILFVNRHKTHLTHDYTKLCKFLKIILIVLCPNATQNFQPCNIVAFHHLKAQWNKDLLCWWKNHPHEDVTKVHIAPILKITLENKMGMAIKNDFRVTGLST